MENIFVLILIEVVPTNLYNEKDGSNVKRISFGKGLYGTPVWSPRGI